MQEIDIIKLQEQAEQGDAEAQYNLGCYYYFGRVIQKDFEKAVHWLTEAADQGNTGAQYWLGHCYDNNGDGFQTDGEKALLWYTKAAEAGNYVAQFYLGCIYHQGEGVPQNFEKAVYWYHRSAAQHHRNALVNLGLCYYKGDGLPKNREDAVYYFNLAAQDANNIAYHNLAFCYANGIGVIQDPEKAEYWYKKYEQTGSNWNKNNDGIYYFHINRKNNTNYVLQYNDQENEILKIDNDTLINFKKPKVIEDFSVSELEELAIYFYKKKSEWPFRYEFNKALLKRYEKLNKNFSWTKSKKKKFLEINDKLMSIFIKSYNEALTIAKNLEMRIQNNDPFLSDYEIEITLQPYIFDKNDYEEDCIALVLSEPKYHPIEFDISHSRFEWIEQEIPVFMDKSINWNNQYLDGVFNDHYICYAIHVLLENHWSFHDILNIDQIWTDVKVIHQNHYQKKIN
ncbi:MAG: sel1 repeat family protein [Treponema sp.]|nr:sel1 repeat family protein [Treponema sp.]